MRYFEASMYVLLTNLAARTDRVLQVFQEFVRYEYRRELKGAKFLLSNFSASLFLDEEAWSKAAPGVRVAMAVLVRKRLIFSQGDGAMYCPEVSCGGTWAKSTIPSWATWYVN